MRHMTLDLETGHVVEITCTQPGNYDGCLMGYAIKFAGSWDGWVLWPEDHGTMRKVTINTNRQIAIKAVVDAWTGHKRT